MEKALIAVCNLGTAVYAVFYLLDKAGIFKADAPAPTWALISLGVCFIALNWERKNDRL